MHNLVIIGGGAAGLSAALEARKINGEANIILISNEKLFYSPCSLPFVIGGYIEGFEKITGNLAEICEEIKIKCVIDEVREIDTENKKVSTKEEGEFPYNSLVIATGGIPFRPPIPGIDKDNIFNLKDIHDAKRILERIPGSKKAAVVGGGAVGIEIAASLRKRGLDVTLIEYCENLLVKSFDADMSSQVKEKLQEEGINVITGRGVEEFIGEGRVTGVKAGQIYEADMVVLGTGVRADGRLAEDAGIETVKGAIKTDGFMQTNINNVYAAGDCTFSVSLITFKPTLSQLGTSAMRQGKAAGANAVGGYAIVEGVLNSMVLKIFDLEIGRTGLTGEDTKMDGFHTVVGKIKTTTKATYFPGTESVVVKLIFNALNRRLIGAQVVGKGEGVAEKIDLCALAIQNNNTMEDLMKLKYCYTPPLTPIDNAIVDAAENAHRKTLRIKEVRKRRF